MATTKFTAFYPETPYWAADAIDFSAPREGNWFYNQMSEVVAVRESANYHLSICRDGRIRMQVPALEIDVDDENMSVTETLRRWSSYFDFLNTFFLLLDSSVVEKDHLGFFQLHEVTSQNVFRELWVNGVRKGESGFGPVRTELQMARFPATFPQPLQIEDHPLIKLRHTVRADTLNYAMEQFDKAFSAGIETPLASFAKSLSEYKLGHFSSCIIYSWFIIESAINFMWEKHLNDENFESQGQKRFSADRLQTLTGRDFTASIMSNVMEIFGLVDLDLFRDINAVRKYRNDLVHDKGFVPDLWQAGQALKTGLQMIAIRWDFHFQPNLAHISKRL